MSPSLYKKENDPKQEGKSRQEPSLETKKNLAILKHIFSRFNLKPKRTNAKQRLKQEFLARTSSLTALNRMAKMMVEFATKGSAQIVRIDLKPATNTTQLLQNLKDYIPLEGNHELSARITLQQPTFSPNKVSTHLKRREKIHNALTIPSHDFASFVIEQILQKQHRVVLIPALENHFNTVSIVGVTLNNLPSAIIFWMNGATGGARITLQNRGLRPPTPRLAL